MVDNNIRYYRKKKGMSANDLSKATKVNIWTIYAYESGKLELNKARLDIANRLSKALGVKIKDLTKDN